MLDKTNKKDINPVTAALTGIVIGAAGAAAVALSDEETRKKATKKANQMKQDLTKWGTAKVKDMRSKGDSVKKSTDKTIDAKKKEITENVKAQIDEVEKN
jgi:gas vesicle protein